jgi:hypothetical protein
MHRLSNPDFESPHLCSQRTTATALAVRASLRSWDHLNGHPEIYTLNHPLSDHLSVIAMGYIQAYPEKQVYYIIWAQIPRVWQRLVVVVASHGNKSLVTTVSTARPTANNGESVNTLPNDLERIFTPRFHKVRTVKHVTQLSVTLHEDGKGDVSVKPKKLEVAQDPAESVCTDLGVIQDLTEMACPVYTESEILSELRLTVTCYSSVFGSHQCIECKVPFKSLGKREGDDFKTFLNDIKLHLTMRHCVGVAKFLGFVVNESRSHLTSYIYEQPAVIELQRVFTVAKGEHTYPLECQRVLGLVDC